MGGRSKGPRPAPGDLGLFQAFLNTVDRRTQRDELASPFALAAWLKRHGLLAAGVELDDADLGRVVRYRQGWRSLLLGSGKEERLLAALDGATDGAALRPRHGRGGEVSFEPLAGGVDGALGRLAAIVHQARADGAWRRLKICPAEGCHTVFYDHSTGFNGKWCRPSCGNRLSSRLSKRRKREAFRRYLESPKARGRWTRTPRAAGAESREDP